jgi:hypothetical protein
MAANADWQNYAGRRAARWDFPSRFKLTLARGTTSFIATGDIPINNLDLLMWFVLS